MLRIGSIAGPRGYVSAARSPARPAMSWQRPRGAALTLGKVHWLQCLGLSLLSPVLICLAFPTFACGPLALIALAPVFLLWSRISWKHAFLWGWLSGTLAYVLLLYWMAGTVFQFTGAWSIPMLILVCSIEALAVAGVAVVASLVGRGAFRPASIIALPAAWLLFESARSYGSLGIPFGALGHAAAHVRWLLPLAAYGGVPLLTSSIALANAAFAAIVGGQGMTRTAGVGVLAALVVVVAAVDIKSAVTVVPAPQLRVAIAQGDISQRVKWTATGFAHAIAQYSKLTEQAAAGGARVVVWPETAITSNPLQDPALRSTLEHLSAKTRTWVIAGSLDQPAADSSYNSVLDITPSGTIGGIYHKRWLMPFAEFLPFESILRHVRILSRSASGFRSGTGTVLLSAGGLRWGSLICYESGFALYARAMVNAGADAIVMVADDDWFAATKEPYQHADVAVIEAASTGRWVVRSTQSGMSEFVDPKGKVVSELGLQRRGIIVCNIGQGIDTPFDRYGAGWLFALSFAVLAGGLLLAWRSARP